MYRAWKLLLHLLLYASWLKSDIKVLMESVDINSLIAAHYLDLD